MTRPYYQMIAQGALAIAALRLPVPKWVTNGCPTHQNLKLILGLLDLPKPEVCGLATQHPLSLTGALVLIKPRLIRALRAVRPSERAVFHRSDGNIITRLA